MNDKNIVEGTVVENDDNNDDNNNTETQPEKETRWQQRLLSVGHWLRFVFMALFAIILGVVGYVMTALVVLQFLWGLITGEGNDKLRDFGSSLSQYIYQILRFLTYNTEDKPFPFADWPDSESTED
ncbi:MAG: DUF4389 domain-containing protein [Pseudomonadota bacterium]